MPPPTSSGRATSRSKPFPSGPSTCSVRSGLDGAESARPRADRVDQEGELAGRCEAERHGSRQHAPGRLEHEELPGTAGVDAAPLEAEQPVGPDGLDARDREALAVEAADQAPAPMRSCSDSAVSARAFAIACTAAAAPEIVVMQGTRPVMAASRIR